MTRIRVDYDWNLRRIMHEHDLHKITDLVPLLEERGIRLSYSQVHRLVVEKPERLSLRTLAALCHIFECEPGDLVVARSENVTRKQANSVTHSPSQTDQPLYVPVRAQILDLGS